MGGNEKCTTTDTDGESEDDGADIADLADGGAHHSPCQVNVNACCLVYYNSVMLWSQIDGTVNNEYGNHTCMYLCNMQARILQQADVADVARGSHACVLQPDA